MGGEGRVEESECKEGGRRGGEGSFLQSNIRGSLKHCSTGIGRSVDCKKN